MSMDRLGSESMNAESGGAASDVGGGPGKRTLSERLPVQRAAAPGGGGAAAAEAGAAGGAHDDAFFFADGGREGGGTGNVDPAAMQAMYYGINPRRHAEKAYQRGDSAPPFFPRGTIVGPSGTIVALATTIYNRPPFGRVANFSILDPGGSVLRSGSVTTPGQVTFTGLPPGSEACIRPETMGTMVKLLTPEQIAGAAEEHEQEAAAGGAAGAHGAGAHGAGDHAAGGHGAGGEQREVHAGPGNMDPGTMQSLYYGINPPRHAEKAYQAGDSAPPLHPRPTTVGKSGQIVALATTIYNKPPFGKVARFSLCDRGGRVLHRGEVKTPGQQIFAGMEPGTHVLIRPETIGTMVKLLTPEQIAGAAEQEHEVGGEHGHRHRHAHP